jgi:aryl-alcohol dehydrogenase-like predicted oxidoreductase
MGESEVVFGRWVASRGVRDDVFVIGKGGHPRDGISRIKPEDISDDLLMSLELMGLNRIDLYMVHRDDTSVPASIVVECLAGHEAAGHIGAYGVSNWTSQRVSDAIAFAELRGLPRVAASSPHFSLAVPLGSPWPGTESIAGPNHITDRRWYEATQLPVLAWSSLSHGFFTGKFSRTNLDQFTDAWDRVVVDTFCSEDNFQRLDRARELAGRYDLSIPQMAIAYVLSSTMNVHALVGCWSGSEYDDLGSVSELTLSEEELLWLEAGDSV